MAYVDGFVLPVPRDEVETYRELARKAGEVWMEQGALSFVECVGDDVPDGKLTSFPMAVKAGEDEVVVLSWITFESREKRDEINARVMADPRIKADMQNMPVDGRRMIFGGFRPIVEL